MEKLISKLVNKFVKESFVDITNDDTDEALDKVTEGKFGDGRDEIDVAEPEGKITPADFRKLKQMKKSENKEAETEEGNAFSGALAKAKEEGDESFEVDGNRYPVKKESVNRKIERILERRKTKLEEKHDDSVEDKKGGSYIGKPLEKLQRDLAAINSKIEDYKKENDTDEIPGRLKEKIQEIRYAIKKARESKNKRDVKETKKVIKNIKENTIRFTESEMIDFIERIVEAEVKEKNTVKSLSQSKKVNDDATKEVVEKMKNYMKNMGKEYDEDNMNDFPTGNKSMSREDFGKEVTDDKKKAYKASQAVEEYIDAFAYPGQTNIVFDEIKPVDEKIEMYLKGNSKTGNAQVDEDGNALGNVVPSKTGEKMFKNYKENLYGAEQQEASYKRVKQPVEVAGEETQEGGLTKSSQKSQKIFDKLGESLEDKKIISDMEKMKKLIGYNQRTQ